MVDEIPKSQYTPSRDPELGFALEDKDWRSALDLRQRQEVQFARSYDTLDYRHGTDGHSRLMLISRLSGILDFILENYDLKEKQRG